MSAPIIGLRSARRLYLSASLRPVPSLPSCRVPVHTVNTTLSVEQFRSSKVHRKVLAGRTPSAGSFVSSTWRRGLSSASAAVAAEEPTDILANEAVVFERVRVIDEKGFVGDMSSQDARELARNRQTDLVVLKAMADPPVCKLTSLDAHIQETEARLRQRHQQAAKSLEGQFAFDPGLKVKGVRISGTAEENDLVRKMKQARNFLVKGHRVDIQLTRGGGTPAMAIERAQRVFSELRDISKPINLPLSPEQFAHATTIIKFWPCTPEQAASFTLKEVVRYTGKKDTGAIEKAAAVRKDTLKSGGKRKGFK
uniref:Translation initiation factor 3 N-terminal domain-containing protein n=1 Tax=Chromera velia CCMP2878 TaxID=1169474 RepID=A0A0G4F0T5_9ALVE|eukprot:Cvel_14484.t1-p1 / transcript=Cvel_14484.t1 / gene=Cvel_14484 / organism=Chromera_velia_CCMP2878 / gene_product=Translation initiation factor IF-3, putative / transcript_product=Translation initiation factor IF-3, putative / location=Cvel_scaffold1032:29489-30415(+) / protein_length=309 / sequence_SO=supercontig / SO=protein_coding / is_pseudo=false